MTSYRYDTDQPELLNQIAGQLLCEHCLTPLAEFFKIMGDPTRLKLLMALDQHELCASDLANIVNSSRSAISHSLKALKAAHLVASRKEGKTVFYRLADEHVQSVLQVALTHVQEKD